MSITATAFSTPSPSQLCRVYTYVGGGPNPPGDQTGYVDGSYRGTVWSGEGGGGNALFNAPYAVTLRAPGLYAVLAVTEGINEDVRILNESKALGGYTTTLTGGSNGQIPGFADGAPPNATFNYPYGIVYDPIPSVTTYYVADSANNKIRNITGDLTTTLTGGLGSNVGGKANGLPNVATFYVPSGIAIPANGGYLIVAGSWLRKW